jgi:succinate dehydrogenase/fumarate reductase flavoprotein subunit
MAGIVQDAGSTVLTDTRVEDLLEDADGLAGVSARRHGQPFVAHARQVILAAGGFQNNQPMLTELISKAGVAIMCRAVAENTGDGLRLAEKLGGSSTSKMGTFYGHLMPAPPCTIDWSDPLQPMLMTAFYAEHGIVIDAAGERFVDEGAGDISGLMVNAAAARGTESLWVVMDGQIRRRYARYDLPLDLLRPTNLRYYRLLPYMGVKWIRGRPTMSVDSIRFVTDRGAVALVDQTIDGLGTQLQQHGVSRAGFLETVRTFNDAVQQGSVDELAVPKTVAVYPLTQPPFLAIKVVPGVSMTYGGVRINEHAQVLQPDNAPVPSLYAVPGTAGGIHERYYAGSLAACGVFGMIAAEHAASAQRSAVHSL